MGKVAHLFYSKSGTVTGYGIRDSILQLCLYRGALVREHTRDVFAWYMELGLCIARRCFADMCASR